MNRYRLTVYFVLTALVSITVALLVVNQVIGEIAEENLTSVAEKNAVRDSIHMQAMLLDTVSGIQRTGTQMADMQATGAMTAGMQHTGRHMTDMATDGAMTPGMHDLALVPEEPLALEYLAGPQGLSKQYSDLVHGLDLVSLELLDLDHNSLWSTDSQIQQSSPVANSQYQLAVQGEISSELVRGRESPTLDRTSPARDLLDVYLPLRSTADGPILGVLKLSRDVTQGVAIQVDQVKRAVLRVTVGTLAGYSWCCWAL